MTGEALPVTRPRGDAVRSGVVNAGSAFDLRATTTAAESTYAGVVRLVESAPADQAPFVRLADRYALVVRARWRWRVAALAWLVSGDATRAVATLVVATPCPLILAAPVAIVSGMSRCARRGVIVKDGAVLERLAGAEVLLFDKTGTITSGQPALAAILTPPGGRWEPGRDPAAGGIARPGVAPRAGLGDRRARPGSVDSTLVLPTRCEEAAGRGVRGRGRRPRRSRSGTAQWVATDRPATRGCDPCAVGPSVTAPSPCSSASTAHRPERSCWTTRFVPDAARTIRGLRRSGIRRMVMVTGDRAAAAETIAFVVGADEVLAERTPADKVEAVRIERARRHHDHGGRRHQRRTGARRGRRRRGDRRRGSTASSEAADAVLTVDRLDRLGEAIVDQPPGLRIARAERGRGHRALAGRHGRSPPPGCCRRRSARCSRRPSTSAVILNALRVAIGGPSHISSG